MAQDFRNALFRQIGTSDQALLAGGNYRSERAHV